MILSFSSILVSFEVARSLLAKKQSLYFKTTLVMLLFIYSDLNHFVSRMLSSLVVVKKTLRDANNIRKISRNSASNEIGSISDVRIEFCTKFRRLLQSKANRPISQGLYIDNISRVKEWHAYGGGERDNKALFINAPTQRCFRLKSLRRIHVSADRSQKTRDVKVDFL